MWYTGSWMFYFLHSVSDSICWRSFMGFLEGCWGFGELGGKGVGADRRQFASQKTDSNI